jgi:hypothetical protein
VIKFEFVEHGLQDLDTWAPPGLYGTEFEDARTGWGESVEQAGGHALAQMIQQVKAHVTPDDLAPLREKVDLLRATEDAPEDKLYFVTIRWRLA